MTLEFAQEFWTKLNTSEPLIDLNTTQFEYWQSENFTDIDSMVYGMRDNKTGLVQGLFRLSTSGPSILPYVMEGTAHQNNLHGVARFFYDDHFSIE